MRSMTAPFVVTLPAGARVQTRLRPSPHDAAVLRIVGECLGGWPVAILPAAAPWALAPMVAPAASGH